MIEPTRLLHDASATEEATSLLRSLSAPVPPSAAKQAELASQLASLANPGLVATAGTAVWVKAALVIGTFGLIATWGVLQVQPTKPRDSELPPAPKAAQVEALLPPVTAAVEPPATTVAPEARVEEVVREAPRPAGRGRVTARDHLAEEEALLEQARRSVSTSPARALSLLQDYQRRFPAGQLSAERMFLGVDVLTRLGRTDAARRQADSLIRAFPKSVYAAQVKARSSNPVH